MPKRAPSGSWRVINLVADLANSVGVKETAKSLGVHPSTIYRWRKVATAGRPGYTVARRPSTIARWEERIKSGADDLLKATFQNLEQTPASNIAKAVSEVTGEEVPYQRVTARRLQLERGTFPEEEKVPFLQALAPTGEYDYEYIAGYHEGKPVKSSVHVYRSLAVMPDDAVGVKRGFTSLDGAAQWISLIGGGAEYFGIVHLPRGEFAIVDLDPHRTSREGTHEREELRGSLQYGLSRRKRPWQQ